MSKAVPWSDEGAGFDAREAVSESARRAGMSVSDWLASAMSEHAVSLGVRPIDLTEDERVQALARKIGFAAKDSPPSPRRWDSEQVLNELQARWPAPRAPEGGARSDVEALIQQVGQRFEARAPAPAAGQNSARPDDVLRVELERLSSLMTQMRRPLDQTGAPESRRQAATAELSALLEAVADLCRGASHAQDNARGSADAGALAELKRDMGVLLGAVLEVQRAGGNSSGGKSGGAAIDDMRRKIADISRTVANLGPGDDVAALNQSVRDLSKRVASSRRQGLRDSIVEPIEGLLVDLKRAIADLNPADTLAAIERQMYGVAAQLEQFARNGAGAGTDAIGRMSDQIADIHALLGKAAQPVRLDHIESQIADLGGRIDRIAERGATAAGERAVAECVETIRAELSGGAYKGLFSALEERIDSLARKLDDSLSNFPVKRLDDIHERLEEMQRSFGEQSLRPGEVARLEEGMRVLQERLDRPDQSAAELAQLNSLVGQLARRVEQAIAAGEGADSLGVIERQVQEIVNRLDQQARPGPDAERLEALLRAVAERLDQPLTPPQLEQVRETVRLLTQDHLNVEGSPDALRAVEAQLAEISARLAEPVSVDFDTSRIETLIHDMSDRLSAAAGGNASDMQDTLGRIAVAVDELGRTSGGGAALHALEMRMAEIAARLDEPVSAELDTSRLEAMVERIGQRLDHSQPGHESDGADTLAGLERSVADIFQHIEQFRETAILTAEHAARKAAREALASVAPPPRSEDPAARVAMEREFADIRSRQSAADQRTNSTLGAVQSTLDQVVDRLAAIERTSVRPPAAFAPSAVASPPNVSPPSASPPSAAPQPFMPPPVTPFTPPTLETAPPPAPVREPVHAPPRPQPGPAPLVAAEPDPASQIDDLLLEPGAGKPAASAMVMPDIAASEDAGAGSGPRASFIAAVRRAQSAAASAQSGEMDVGARPESALDQTRARARAAASKTQNSAPPAAAGKFRSMFARAARTTLYVALGVAVLLGAGKIGLSMLEEVEIESPVEQSALPPAAAPDIGKSSLSAFGAPRQSANAPAPSPSAAPALAARNPDVDPSTVASIDRSSQAPSKPQDLRSAAGSGMPLAQFEIGLRYAEGRGITRDLAQAAAWFERAAQQEHAPAQYRLGALYEKGTGVERDLEKAQSWYQRAAERGNVRAMHNLAVLIAEGAAGKPDYASAAQWFRAAAEHGVRDSQYNFAILNARGLGTAQDMVQSYMWFSLAAAQGDEDAGKKRADVAARLDARQLSKARALVDNFTQRKADHASNDTSAPPGGWDFAPEAKETPKTAPQRPGAPKARVSRL